MPKKTQQGGLRSMSSNGDSQIFGAQKLVELVFVAEKNAASTQVSLQLHVSTLWY